MIVPPFFFIAVFHLSHRVNPEIDVKETNRQPNKKYKFNYQFKIITFLFSTYDQIKIDAFL